MLNNKGKVHHFDLKTILLIFYENIENIFTFDAYFLSHLHMPSIVSHCVIPRATFATIVSHHCVIRGLLLQPSSSTAASSEGLLLPPSSATAASSEGYFCNQRQPLLRFCNHRQSLRHPEGYFCNHCQPLLRCDPRATFATASSHQPPPPSSCLVIIFVDCHYFYFIKYNLLLKKMTSSP